ncbi:Heparinase ii iii family protein [Mycena sanguinolenta]|uniref:Heparinase ii iii family protein n=1 Tax=Mycena sanguinolenta TaxID=230812 RepID=A0A8H6Z9M3_9AGAR|nr:Heparinase ii iii family protein [Mycena sanguinolenta]
MAVTVNLAYCLSRELLGPGLSYASATLFLFDYCVTFLDELRFIWVQRRSTSTVLFWITRYAGMASAIVTLCQTPTTSLLVTYLSTALRVIVILAAELVLAVRTWAIWERRRSILIFLCLVSTGAVGVIANFLIRGLNDTYLDSDEGVDGDCIVVANTRSKSYLIPYVVVIAYETMTMVLSAVRIMKLRSQITSPTQIPLLSALWNDALGIVNILIICRGSVTIRTGGAQLQTSLHSILSTRIILPQHLAKLGDSRRRGCRAAALSSSAVSSLFMPTTVLLTTDETSFWDLDYDY